MKFYLVDGPQLWGDYGNILVAGMSAHLGRDRDGLIQLERTGPFAPPITFPGIHDIVVTSAFRAKIAASGLAVVSFKPVRKVLITELRWEQWDRSSEPSEYPDSGEPEDYILANAHSPGASDAMGDLWEVVVPRAAHVDTKCRVPPLSYRVRVHVSTWTGVDMFRAHQGEWLIVSEKGRDWFLENAEDWVSFTECLVK